MRTKKKYVDLKIISYYIGYVVLSISLLMLIPMFTAMFFKEWDVVLNFIISSCISFNIALILIMFGRDKENEHKVEWKHGLIIAAASWVILMILCAIPYRLSGNYLSFTDACFDVMSGFTTTGLAMVQDLDHASVGLNMWRHILTFVGGQGMVVLALSFIVKNTVGSYSMYVGEGKDVGLVPNVKGTAKIIWIISMIYLAVGTLVFWIDGMFIGLKPANAFLHGLFIYMSSWSTGGFSPMSQGIIYYHSISYEIITIIFFTIGSFNFGLHYAIWQGNKKEIFKNIETKSFFITVFLTTFFAAIGLKKLEIYTGGIAVFRRVFYNVISAHTTTGFANVYVKQFAEDWGGFGVFIMVIAMMIGGSACSTAGGIKGLRVGIVAKGVVAEIKRLLGSERKVSISKFHYMKDEILTDNVVKSSLIIIVCYIILFTLETGIGLYYNYSFANSAFEAASVTGNVGLTIGVTSPSMPVVMKIMYIIGMYLGRLEFISAFALMGFILGGVKRLWKR